MTKRKTTKRALLMSVVSMLLCVSMLVGSTFAWFTDSVSSGKSRIVAGNLDVELSYKTGGMTDWRDVESLNPEENKEDINPFFRGADGKNILWEPGAIGVTSFKVENVGTLAFKYAIALLAVKYNQLDGRDLRDVIKVAVIDGELPEGFTAEAARNLTYSAFSDFTKRSALLPEEQEIFTVVAYWKPNSDSIDNLYNVSNGKIATELDGTPSTETELGNRLYIDMDVRLNAWQNTVENDSFDNQYDAMADALDVFPDGCYAVTEHESWVELDIYTGRSTADINISYTGYAPDNTDERMRTWTTGASGTITPAAANGNTHLIFFKTAEKGNFTLTQDGRALSALPVKEGGATVQRMANQSGAVYSARNAVAPAAAVNAVSAPAVSVDQSKAIVVSSEAEMKDVIAALNQNGGEKTVKLSNDIDFTGAWSLNKGTLTILGEGHTITNKIATDGIIINNTAILNLGAVNYDKSLKYCASLTNTGPLISAGGNAQLNIYEHAVIDGAEKSRESGVRISNNATVNLCGGTIQNCICHPPLAAGVSLFDSAKFNMFNGEIKNCSAGNGPGAVSISQALGYGIPDPPAVFNMYDGTISGCSGKFGAIYLDKASIFNMSGGTIKNCTGTFGGGVYTGDTAVFNMSGGTIKNCTGAYGGGIYMQATSVFNMSGGTIEGCHGQLGGGICLNQSAEFNMKNGTIEGCQGMLGGGVLAIATSAFNMSGGTIRGCTSEEAGGGVFANISGVFTMSGGTIESCQATLGGGVYTDSSKVVTMSGGTIRNCVSTGSLVEGIVAGGAAVCVIGDNTVAPQFIMDGGLITGCRTEAKGEFAGCDVYGGAIFVGGGTVTLNKGEITGNSANAGEAKSAYGGGIGAYYVSPTKITIKDGFMLYDNTADTAGADIARQSNSIELSLGNVNTEVELSDGDAVDGWYKDESGNRWGSENYPYDEAKIAAGETTAQYIKAAHGETIVMKGAGAPGRLLDLYDGEDSSALISKGGAKTVKWLLKSSDLADRINASAPIAAGTKITMAYKDDAAIVSYYYLIVKEGKTTISLSEFTAMGGNGHFAPEEGIKNPLYQFSFVFPTEQKSTTVWMSKEVDNIPNESAVNINFAETGLPVPSGNLEANGNTVTVSGLTGLAADPSDSRHNTLQPLADRKAVLAIEAVDAQGRNVAMSSDTVVTVGGNQAKVSAGIAATVIADGTYTIEVLALPEGAVGIRVSLCYTYNNIIYKPMANVLKSVTVNP